MSEVNLKRFVDINIQPHTTIDVERTRDTIVLFTYEGTSGKVATVTNQALAENTAITGKYEDESTATYAYGGDTYNYLAIYFANGGLKARVIEGKAYSALTTNDLTALENKYICVGCVCADNNVESCYSQLKSIATNLNADDKIYGINEKLIIARTEKTDDDSSVKNFAVKYSTIPGAEMTMAAYLSKTDIDEADSIFDYAFTEEVNYDSWNEDSTIAEDIDTDTYDTLMANNENVDIYLANAVRNVGGNCKDGEDLINSYVKIILHQTLTDALLSLLTQKIKNSTGISKIYSVIAQELERYLNCGYLTTYKLWTDSDLVVNYNSANYTIIQKGDALLNGYLIRVLPYYSLSTADKEAHKTPPIYVIIADQYGIRKITIDGEII